MAISGFPVSGGGGVGATNLSFDPVTSMVASDTGTDAVLTLADVTNPGLMTSADFTKLAGVAPGATANSTDGQLVNRANHTNTQLASTVSNFDEAAQDAVGAMVDASLVYVDATPLLQRAALTGAVTAGAGSNATALGSFTKAELDTAVSDGNVQYVGDAPTAHTHLLAAGATDVTVTAANLNALDDGVDTTLHFHAADRARGVHTGTQLAATISDFDTAVSATASVTANTAKVTNATHTGEVTGSGALTITAGAVTLAKMADVATATVFYRKTAATGVPEVQTLATLKTDLGLTGTNSGDQATNLTYTAATRVMASSTGTSATVPLMSSADAGLVPASGGGTANFLRADGAFAVPAGGAAITVQDEGSNITTALATLNFVGAGVTVTGGATATVTIPGGSGSYVSPLWSQLA